MSADRIDVALVGCGHMGSHHARVVSADPSCRLVATIDTRDERASTLAERYGARACRTVPEQVDAVIVATPTTSHVEVATPLLDRGLWCLVEKSLAPDVAAAQRLYAARLVVGHSERFNPAVRAVGRPDVRNFESRRHSPPSARAGDVVVVLDLMIHDLDLLLWWCGGVAELVAVHGDLDEHASAVLRTKSGEATLTVSRNAPAPERRVRLHGVVGEHELDMLTGRAWRSGDELQPPDDRDALTAQWDAFVQAVSGRASSSVTAGEAIAALRLAERIGEALRDTGP